MPLSFPFFRFLDKDDIRDSVPDIANANKEEQQRRSAHDEKGWTRMGVSHIYRSCQHCIRRKWKQNIKQPVLKYGLVGGLHPHAPRHDDDVYTIPVLLSPILWFDFFDGYRN